jgi:Iap family predicted aminopeptidase
MNEVSGNPSHQNIMSKKQKIVTAILLSQMLFPALSGVSRAQQEKINFSTPEQIKEEFNTVPCKDNDRLNAVKALFEKIGAAPSDITIENFKNVENLLIRKQGKTDEKIVIGAHYDKVPEGCGAIDNWTGIVAMAHLYKTLKNYLLTKTVLFVAFGKEEKGLIGSRAMTNAIKKEDLMQYCAMINIDSLGLAAPQILANLSSDPLEKLAVELGENMGMKIYLINIPEAGADSISFMSKKIPALTISGVSRDWSSILHTSKDKPTTVNADSVYMGYRLALAIVASVSEAPCSAYR